MLCVSQNIISPGNISLDVFFRRDLILDMIDMTLMVIARSTPRIDEAVQFRWFHLLVSSESDVGIAI